MNGTLEKNAVSQAVILDTLRSVLSERGEIALLATGFSMGPIFQGAESLVIRAGQPGRRIVPGSILVFERNERWVAHRVWLTWGEWLLTGGDAIWTLDWPPPRRNAVEGVVVALWQQGRRVELESANVWWRRFRWMTGGIGRLFWTLFHRPDQGE
jgi:hypothetical protein